MSDTDEDVPPQLRELERTLTIREQVLDVLLEKVQADRYPSSTTLDDLERLLTPWRREDYAEVLMEKIRADRFPSRSMIERLVKLSG